MICTKCGNECGNDKFCGKCGSPLYRRCYYCGKEITINNHYCPHCGNDNSELSINAKRQEKKRAAQSIRTILVILLIIAGCTAIGVLIGNCVKKLSAAKEAEIMQSRTELVHQHFYEKGDIDLGTFLYKQTSDNAGTIVHITLKPLGDSYIINGGQMKRTNGYYPVVETNEIIGSFSIPGLDYSVDQRQFANKVIEKLSTPSSLSKVDSPQNSTYKYSCIGDLIEVWFHVSEPDEPLESSYMVLHINGGGKYFDW